MSFRNSRRRAVDELLRHLPIYMHKMLNFALQTSDNLRDLNNATFVETG